jgi:hypothetical protein
MAHARAAENRENVVVLSCDGKKDEFIAGNLSQEDPAGAIIVVNFGERTVTFGSHVGSFNEADAAHIQFGRIDEVTGTGFTGDIDRVTGETHVADLWTKNNATHYSLVCKPTTRVF